MSNDTRDARDARDDRTIIAALALIGRKLDALPAAYLAAKGVLTSNGSTQLNAAASATGKITAPGFEASGSVTGRVAIENWPRLITAVNQVLAALQDGNRQGSRGSGGTRSRGSGIEKPAPIGPISPDEMRAAIFAATPLVKAALAANPVAVTDPNAQREALLKDGGIQSMGMTAQTIKKLPDAFVAKLYGDLPPPPAPSLTAKGLTGMSNADVAALHAQLPKPPTPPPSPPPLTWTPRKRPPGWKRRAKSAIENMRGIFTPKSRVQQRKDMMTKSMRAGKAASARAARSPAAATAAKVGGAVVGALSKIANPIILLLTPLTLLAQVVSSSASGFGVVISATKLLAATLAPLLLPIFFALAVGLADMSDMIWAKLLPALKDWYTLVIGPMLGAMTEMVSVVKDVIDVYRTLKAVAGASRGDPASIVKLASAIGRDGAMAGARQLDRVMPFLTKGTIQTNGLFERGVNAAQRAMPAAEGSPAAARDAESKSEMLARLSAETRADMTRGNSLNDNKMNVLRELQLGMGAKASIGSVAGVNRTAQMAAMNMSPFETKLLEKMQQAIDELTRQTVNTTKDATGLYPPSTTAS